MGMFDLVKCEHPSIAEEWRGYEFQTKDTAIDSLGCNMDDITITADGRFLRCEAATGKRGAGKPEPFTGDLEFYNYVTKDKFILFRARFEKGNLVGPIAGPFDTLGEFEDLDKGPNGEAG